MDILLSEQESDQCNNSKYRRQKMQSKTMNLTEIDSKISVQLQRERAAFPYLLMTSAVM